MAEEHKISIEGPVQVKIEQNADKAVPETVWGMSAMKLDFVKWLIGSVVIAGIGIATNIFFQSTEIHLKQLEIDAQLINVVSQKFDTTAAWQVSYLKFIKPFVSDSLKYSIEDRLTELRPLVRSQLATAANDSVVKATSKTKKNLPKELQDSLRKAARQISTGTPKSMETFIQKENTDKKLTEHADAPIDASAIKAIETSQVVLTPKTVNDYVLDGTSETLWCKENYYVEFFNSLRIGVVDLKGSQVKVLLSRLDENGNATMIREEFLQPQSPYNLEDDNNYKYTITISYIGGAGRNPFTRAAYFSVARYVKKK